MVNESKKRTKRFEGQLEKKHKNSAQLILQCTSSVKDTGFGKEYEMELSMRGSKQTGLSEQTVASQGEVFGEQKQSAYWEGERILAVPQIYHPPNPPYIVKYMSQNQLFTSHVTLTCHFGSKKVSCSCLRTLFCFIGHKSYNNKNHTRKVILHSHSNIKSKYMHYPLFSITLGRF